MKLMLFLTNINLFNDKVTLDFKEIVKNERPK
jgi:hypothetical protein